MRLKKAYLDGQSAAMDQYGEKPRETFGQKARRWLPAVAAAGAAGLGAYGLSRMPRFSSNPVLRQVQEHAAEHGFHRLHDVSPKGDITTGYDFLPSLWQHTLPQVNAEGKLTPWNKFKLWFHEGSEAIPVASMKPGEKAFIPGRPQGVDVKGTVFDRTARRGASELVRGGVDAEGPMAIQQTLSDLGDAGKAVEADLLQKHAPNAIPRSFTNLHEVFTPSQAGATRTQQIQAMQRQLSARAKGEGVKDYALKVTHGLDSGGEFPRAKDDWGKMIGKFDKFMANPKNAARWQELQQKNDWSDITEFLHEHDLYKPYVLDTMLKDPRKVYAQDWLPGAMGEWRVHTVNGSAPTELLMPRNKGDAIKSLFTGNDAEMSGALKHFVENDVLAKLPEEYRKGMYGMDVMPFRKPDGSIEFKVMELNPHGMSTAASGGGGSGLLEPEFVPGAAWRQYKAMTGKDIQPVAVAKALGAAGLAGGAAKALTPDAGTAEENDEPPMPV
jgi:hypothetical protein